MQPFPHRYLVHASVRPDGDVPLSADGMRIIESARSKEFGGPGNQWSPEGLVAAAVADGFALNFRALATAAHFGWTNLDARTTGTLDTMDGRVAFIRFDTHAKLLVPAGGDAGQAEMLLNQAATTCPVANSLLTERHLTVEIVIA